LAKNKKKKKEKKMEERILKKVTNESTRKKIEDELKGDGNLNKNGSAKKTEGTKLDSKQMKKLQVNVSKSSNVSIAGLNATQNTT